MSSAAARPRDPAGPNVVRRRLQIVIDVLLAASCVAITLMINLSGSESVSANREPNILIIVLTVLAVAPIALRRRFPLAVLTVTLGAVLGLILMRGTVGIATIGPFIATYTAVAQGTARNSRRAIAMVVLALVLTLIMDPVDLSRDGAILSGAAFAAIILFATSTRARREGAEASARAAERELELERERAAADRERASWAATQERLRITRDVHDVIGHSMSVMIVQAGAAGRLLDTGDPERARSAVAEIEHTGRAAMTEMRGLLSVLRDGASESEGSPRSPTPSLNDVGPLLARVNQAGLPTTFAVNGTPREVTAGVDLAAYRIVQEALTNCLKHASATWAAVDVTYRPTEIEISITNDGSGTGSVTAEPGSGHGLDGMSERVAAHGGDFSVGDRLGGGFRVMATFPLQRSP